jgi:dTDP-4-dehydrorhamnose 3,5-epimerase
MLTVTPTNLADVVLLEPARHGDARGFFSESWSAAHMKSAGLDFDFVQDNHSGPATGAGQAGALRARRTL